MNNCIFCQIAKKEVEHYVLWEDENFVMFLTKKPIRGGHTLIIPRQHVDYYFDLPKNIYDGVLEVARWYAPMLKKITEAHRIGMAVEGFGIAHAHLHVIPLHQRGDMFSRIGVAADPSELETMAGKIREALSVEGRLG